MIYLVGAFSCYIFFHIQCKPCALKHNFDIIRFKLRFIVSSRILFLSTKSVDVKWCFACASSIIAAFCFKMEFMWHIHFRGKQKSNDLMTVYRQNRANMHTHTPNNKAYKSKVLLRKACDMKQKCGENIRYGRKRSEVKARKAKWNGSKLKQRKKNIQDAACDFLNYSSVKSTVVHKFCVSCSFSCNMLFVSLPVKSKEKKNLKKNTNKKTVKGMNSIPPLFGVCSIVSSTGGCWKPIQKL